MKDTSKVWKWMVVILAVLNIALLVTIWCGRPRHNMRGEMPHEMGERGPQGGGRPSDIIIHELNFSPEQIKQFEALKEEHQQAIRKLMDDGHTLRDNFFELLKSDSVNQSSVKEKGSAIAANQQGIELATFNHFQKVRAICNAEQKKHFDEIINDVLKQMGRPHGKPGEGPPPPPMH